MENKPRNEQQIISRHIPGFHQYCLDAPARLVYASRNLCELLGFSAEELVGDRYAQRVHPADRQGYADYLDSLACEEQTQTLQYRLVKKNGDAIYVSDTMTSYRQGGAMMGDSVLTDITKLKQENQNLQFLNETVPCGFVKYTCEKQPKVTYINEQMLQFLGFPDGGDAGFDTLEMYKQNIYLMIPAEERRRFSVYLNRVYRHSAPIAGELTVQRWDGSRARLFGWVTKCVNAQGVEEFQSACIDITQRHQLQQERETARYLRALSEVYDKIFEYDLSNRTVKCLYGKNSPMFRWIENIPMQMEEATEKWILGNVAKQDLETVRRFFSDFYTQKFIRENVPPVVQYRALSSDGIQKAYTGVFVKLNSSVSLFCCRNMPENEDAAILRSENTSLKGLNENMQKLVMQFTDGLAAFEIVDDVVTPLYASENVCDFFGYSHDAWLGIMEKRTPIREFIAHSKGSYADFMELLDKGEAEFTYYDLQKQRSRRIRAICSQKTREPSSPRYVMLYNVDGSEAPAQAQKRVRIRTFGYFDVFVDENPIAFRNEKSKELFALLVDRRGGFISSEEAISFLWEDEPANSVTLARYRKVALRLKNILEEYGISEIVESKNGKRRLDTGKVSCDLYDYLSGRPECAQLFKGSYLTNYSWAESTLAELTGDHLYGTGE